MANITEVSQWDTSVYQIGTTDLVKGGNPATDGYLNKGVQNLANRTSYLKQLLANSEIYVDSGSFRHFSQSLFHNAVFDASVSNGDAVYLYNGKFYKAIAQSALTGVYSSPSIFWGIADVTNSKVALSGVVDIGANTLTTSRPVYLSATTAGALTSTKTDTLVGYYDTGGVLLLRPFDKGLLTTTEVSTSGGYAVGNYPDLESLLQAISTGVTGKEPAFSKNTAFNKNFAGTGAASTVARSDHNHAGIYEPVITKNTAFNKNFSGTGAASTVARSDHNHLAEYSLLAATNGYTKLPNGLIMQWGEDSVAVNSSKAITWPIPFPNAIFNANCCLGEVGQPHSDWSIFGAAIHSLTTTGAIINGPSYEVTPSPFLIRYFAVGN